MSVNFSSHLHVRVKHSLWTTVGDTIKVMDELNATVILIAAVPIWIVGSILAALVFDGKIIRVIKVFRVNSLPVLGLAVALFMFICGYVCGVFT